MSDASSVATTQDVLQALADYLSKLGGDLRGVRRAVLRELSCLSKGRFARVTSKELSRELGWGRTAILGAIASLRDRGLLKRTGQNRTTIVWNLRAIAKACGIELKDPPADDVCEADGEDVGAIGRFERELVDAVRDGVARRMRDAAIQRGEANRETPEDAFRPERPREPEQSRMIVSFVRELSQRHARNVHQTAREVGELYYDTQKDSPRVVAAEFNLQGGRGGGFFLWSREAIKRQFAARITREQKKATRSAPFVQRLEDPAEVERARAEAMAALKGLGVHTRPPP